VKRFALLLWAFAAAASAAPLDLSALWDFNQPALSAQRFRERLATASGDQALILQTQIARTEGLQRRFEAARELLRPLQPQLAKAGDEAVVRWHLEWGRSLASAVHDTAALPPADIDAARSAFRTAAERARAAGLEGLAVDALHMLPFTTTDATQGMRWTQDALDLALASSQPAARAWEASLLNNLGWALTKLGRTDEALAKFQQAAAARDRTGSPERARIAHWRVAHTLRSLKRHDEALAIQLRLERENAATGTPDRYVFEELAHLYRALGDSARAADYDLKAQR
jgi:tetratricopeptide (TPR) repeat protein